MELNLSKEEQAAKDFLIKLFTEGEVADCDEDHFEPKFPDWYDAARFKRGQQFFQKYCSFFQGYNIIALIQTLSQEKGLVILHGRDTPAGVGHRYVKFILIAISWFEEELLYGSRPWKSLTKVRRLHQMLSKVNVKRKNGNITQTDVSFTQLGFVSYLMIRPHALGLAAEHQKEIDDYIYLWAVLGYFLGVRDEYNVCLFPTDVAKCIASAVLRYYVVGAMQLHTPLFTRSIRGMLEGMNKFFPYLAYDSHIFLTKRVVGVPGYQYNIDCIKEVVCRPLFTEEEVKKYLEMRVKRMGYEFVKFMFFSKIPVYTFSDCKPGEATDVIIEGGVSRPMEAEFSKELREYLILEDTKSITLRLVDEQTEWPSLLNDSKYYELSDNAKKCVNANMKLASIAQSAVGAKIFRWFYKFVLIILAIYAYFMKLRTY